MGLSSEAAIHHAVYARLERIIERFFRSLKEACVWQQQLRSFAAARREIAASIRSYNEARPCQALGYRSPREHGEADA